MPFRFFALIRWHVKSFCSILIGWPSSLRKPESKRYRVASNLFLSNHMPQSGYHEMRTHRRESVVLLSPCIQHVAQEIRNRYVCFILSNIKRQRQEYSINL